VTDRDLERMMTRMGWSRREMCRRLGITQDRLRRYLRRQVPVPRLVELACMTLAAGDDIGDWDWR